MCDAVCDGGSLSPLVFFSPCFCKRPGLKEGMTDDGLRALASVGCGKGLTSLSLGSECCCVPVCGLMMWVCE